MTEVARDPSLPPETGIWIQPPFLVLTGLLASFLPYLAWPFGLGLPWYLRTALALALMAPLPLVFPAIMREFGRAGSAYDVRKLPKGLVTGGPFRFSRNPGYVLFVLFFTGIAIAADNAWAFPFILASLIPVHRIVRQEEELLEKRFGQAYLDYKNRVRRWI